MLADRFRTLLSTAPVIDGHNDLPWEMRGRVRYDLDRLDVGIDQSGSGLHTDLVRLRAGGVGAQFWSAYVSASLAGEAAVAATLEQIDFVYRLAERYADRMALARDADQITAVHRSGRIAALIGIEGGHCIADSLDNLRMMFDRGAMYLTLTHSRNTAWADSATDAPGVGGLAPFGQEVVRECNRLGMLVDLSHTAVSTMEAALDVSAAPAFFSHSSARALCDHPRNVPDTVLARVADSAGIVMVTFVPGFLNDECREWWAELGAFEATIEVSDDCPVWRDRLAAWVRANPRPPCSVADVADHVEHIREVAGVDCVGLGSDFDGACAPPDGLSDVAAYPNLLAELSERGWSEADLAKLTWHNALRVIRDTARYGEPVAERTAA